MDAEARPDWVIVGVGDLTGDSAGHVVGNR